MGNPAGVKRDFAGVERRRMAAAKLLQQGVSQAEVARRVGVHRQSVIRWVRELRKALGDDADRPRFRRPRSACGSHRLNAAGQRPQEAR